MARQDYFTHFRQGNLLVVPKREIPGQTIRSSANIIRLAQHVKKQIICRTSHNQNQNFVLERTSFLEINFGTDFILSMGNLHLDKFEWPSFW